MIIKTFAVGVMRANCYLVYGNKAGEAVLFDPGKGFERISSFCQSEGVKVTAVFLTHGHFDHILEASIWQNNGAKIYIHRLDEEKLNSEKNLAYLVGASVAPCKADILLDDGEEIVVAGFTIKVIHTPGHSVGSVCYLIENTLFTGDTLFHGDCGRTDFPDGSQADLVKSIQKLFALPGDYTVLPGHEEGTTMEEERKNNDILRYL